MKHRALLSVLAIAGLAATGMLAVGAAPASAATKLCKVKEAVCMGANIWPAMTPFAGAATNTKVTIEPKIEGKFVFIEITCTNAALKGKTKQKETPVEIEVTMETMTFEGCSSKQAEGCSVEAVNEAFAAGFLGTMTGNGTFETNIELRISCENPAYECIYSGGGALRAIGGNPGAIEAAQTIARIAGPPETCPSLANWTGKYPLSEPKPIWFTT